MQDFRRGKAKYKPSAPANSIRQQWQRVYALRYIVALQKAAIEHGIGEPKRAM